MHDNGPLERSVRDGPSIWPDTVCVKAGSLSPIELCTVNTILPAVLGSFGKGTYSYRSCGCLLLTLSSLIATSSLVEMLVPAPCSIVTHNTGLPEAEARPPIFTTRAMPTPGGGDSAPSAHSCSPRAAGYRMRAPTLARTCMPVRTPHGEGGARAGVGQYAEHTQRRSSCSCGRSPRKMSPKEPDPIFRPRRYLLPTRSSMAPAELRAARGYRCLPRVPPRLGTSRSSFKLNRISDRLRLVLRRSAEKQTRNS